MSIASTIIERIQEYEPYVKVKRTKECPYCHAKFSPQNVVDYLVHLRQHKKHETFDEKLTHVGIATPFKSLEALDTYGWDRHGNSNKYTHNSFPGHQIHVTSQYIRHTHHGIGTNVPHDDFPKYLRGVHQEQSGNKNKKYDWSADSEYDDI